MHHTGKKRAFKQADKIVYFCPVKIKMEPQEQEIILDYATLHYEEPIVHIVFQEGAQLGFPEMRRLIACAEKLSGKKPYFVFSDVRANVQVTREGKRVAKDINEAPLHLGSAILLNSNMLAMGINFFQDLGYPQFPFRAFTDKQEAIDWLLKLPTIPLLRGGSY